MGHNQSIKIYQKKTIQGVLDNFNKNVESNKMIAKLSEKLTRSTKPSGNRMESPFSSWCCPRVLCVQDNCIFAWCIGCHNKMTEQREGESSGSALEAQEIKYYGVINSSTGWHEGQL